MARRRVPPIVFVPLDALFTPEGHDEPNLWTGPGGPDTPYLHPRDLRRCPHGCEPYAWRERCRCCGTRTVSLWS